MESKSDMSEEQLPSDMPSDRDDWGHWVAEPMHNVGTWAQFHEVVDRAEILVRHIQRLELELAAEKALREGFQRKCEEFLLRAPRSQPQG